MTDNTQQTPELDLTQFFETEYIDFAVYDNVRKIACYVDGQKNSGRKIMHTVLQQNIDKFTKVSNLGPKVQDFAQYLHGSLEGSVVNMTANYVGSGNNMPLLEGDGNFGSTFIPEAAATRYIFARMSPVLKKLFVKDDFDNLPAQTFEGSKIEPRYYVPALPLIAINGSEGISIGFAQRILPRDPAEIIKWVEQRAKNKKKITADLTPHWLGMKCVVENDGDPHQWAINGSWRRKSSTRIVIESLPIGFNLASYLKVLNKLVEDKQIKDYDDRSDNDIFEFEIKVDRHFTERDDDWIQRKLRLTRKVTENYTCIDENNKVIIFDSIEDVLEAWYQMRIKYNDLRKQLVLKKLTDEIEYASARASFVEGVVNKHIELRSNSEKNIIEEAEDYDPKLIGMVPQFLKLAMRTLTAEEISKLRKRVKELKKEYTEYDKQSFEDILLADVARIK